MDFTADAALASFSPSVPNYYVCPNEEITFNCSVVDGGQPSPVTAWRISSMFSCVILHSFGDPLMCGPDDEFMAELGTADGDCYPSTLSVTATFSLNGTFVQCFGPLDNVEVGNTTLRILGESATHMYTYFIRYLHTV